MRAGRPGSDPPPARDTAAPGQDRLCLCRIHRVDHRRRVEAHRPRRWPRPRLIRGPLLSLPAGLLPDCAEGRLVFFFFLGVYGTVQGLLCCAPPAAERSTTRNGCCDQEMRGVGVGRSVPPGVSTAVQNKGIVEAVSAREWVCCGKRGGCGGSAKV